MRAPERLLQPLENLSYRNRKPRQQRTGNQLAVDEFPIADKFGGQPLEAFNGHPNPLYFAGCSSNQCARLCRRLS